MCEELADAGYEVIGTTAGDPQAGERTLDITSLPDCRRLIGELKPEFIVHLAAISFVAHDDPLEMYNVNVIGTTNLLQACVDVGHEPRKILIASSANIYGNAEGVVDEDAPAAPVNHYAASKLAMEHLVRTWFDRLPIVVTRPFNYTGRGQSERFLVPKIVSHFVRRRPFIELGNINVARDFRTCGWCRGRIGRCLNRRLPGKRSMFAAVVRGPSPTSSISCVRRPATIWKCA